MRACHWRLLVIVLACVVAAANMGWAVEVVVDNDGGAPGYAETGSWTTSSSTGYLGGTYRTAFEVPTQSACSATWTPSIPTTGVYDVYAAYRQSTNRTTGAPIAITHDAGTSTIYLNQSGTNTMVEVYLGTFTFKAGTSGSVRMTNNGAAGAYIADAMIWRTYVDTPPTISSVICSPSLPTPADTVTVRATITDTAAVTSAALCYSVSPSGQTAAVQAFDDGAHGDGAAGDTVYAATIPAQPHDSVVVYSYTAWDSAGQSSVSLPLSYTVGQTALGNVYVVLSSDTSVWDNTSGADVAFTYNNEIDWEVFESTTGAVSQVFDSGFRNAHTDSLGHPFKLTWFMHGGGWFTRGKNSTPISALYHIRKNWGSRMDTYGDGLEYHFHHYVWTASGWAQAPTFAETIWEYEWAMSQMMLDERLFAVAFRSGWNYMDNPYEQYLERWVPFRMEGVQTNWLAYHPNASNWRVAGAMKGWETRHIYMKNFTSYNADQAFSAAATGVNQVMCIWSHQNETDFASQVATVDQRLHTAAAAYPGVLFHYCSAKEAMQRWLNHGSGNVPPPLSVIPAITGDMVTVAVHSIDSLYQEQPWVAARKYAGEHVRFNTLKTGPGAWSFSYSRRYFDRVVVGLSDIYGNAALAEVEDGSRRWAVQSEFARARPFQVDFDSLPTCVQLAKQGGAFVSSGTLTFSHALVPGTVWDSIILEGETTAGTSLRCRYRTAEYESWLDTAAWSAYSSERTIMLPPGLQQCIQIEARLETSSSVSPGLNSVEVKSVKGPAGATNTMWPLYE